MPASELQKRRRRALENRAAALLRRLDPPFTRAKTAELLGMTVPQVRACEMKIAKLLVEWGDDVKFKVPIKTHHD